MEPFRSQHNGWRPALRSSNLQLPFLPLPPMGCDAYCLGGGTSLLSTAAFRRRKRTTRCDVTADWASGESSDRRWYNPKRPRPSKPYRPWVEAENCSTLLDSGEDRFLVISYNILGVNNSLEHPDLYTNVPFDAIQWESRKRLIFEDIRRWNADIVCLQEVDRYYDLETNMKKDGYVGRYKRRTGDAKDGCAIFWKKKMFRLLEGHTIEFNALGLRDNVAQLFVFETGKQQFDSRRVVIGNIHVLFNPKRGDIKLGQVRILLQQAHVLSEKWGGIPIVLAGDFNSTPQSAIYEFLSTSELNITRHDRKCMSRPERFQPTLHSFSGLINHSWTDEELKNATGHSSCKLLTHPFKLHSSYARVSGAGRTRGSCGEPLATTYHSKFMGTVDYLWLTCFYICFKLFAKLLCITFNLPTLSFLRYSGELEPARVLDTLPIAALKSIGGLPSQNIGSDHLALASELVFITRSTELKSQGQGAEKEETSERFLKLNS